MTDETNQPGSGKGINFDNIVIGGVNVKDRLTSLWNGDIPLVQTFWLYYFLAVFVLKIIGNAVGGSLGGIVGILALGWAAFMIKPIIASADRYMGEKQWAMLAKIAALVIGLGVLLDLFS